MQNTMHALFIVSPYLCYNPVYYNPWYNPYKIILTCQRALAYTYPVRLMDLAVLEKRNGQSQLHNE